MTSSPPELDVGFFNSFFPYPGGKSLYAPWIIDHFPDHSVYVEPMCGSAAVLANKPRSEVEVINDVDGDIIHFFQVVRERPDELIQWLRDRPYSRDLHRKYAGEFYDGYRPDDDIDRAGRFFYLRQTQFGNKYKSKSGYRRSRHRDFAGVFVNNVEQLKRAAHRLREVQIDNADYEQLLKAYDSTDTLWYFDPPYFDVGDDIYSHGKFDHERFAEALGEIDGHFVVSYGEIPNPLQQYEDQLTVVERNVEYKNGGWAGDGSKEAVERLIMNFDPEVVPSMTDANQRTLTEVPQ